jgi:hypothetical protein
MIEMRGMSGRARLVEAGIRRRFPQSPHTLSGETSMGIADQFQDKAQEMKDQAKRRAQDAKREAQERTQKGQQKNRPPRDERRQGLRDEQQNTPRDPMDV